MCREKRFRTTPSLSNSYDVGTLLQAHYAFRWSSSRRPRVRRVERDSSFHAVRLQQMGSLPRQIPCLISVHQLNSCCVTAWMLASERYHQSLDFSESRSRHNVKDAELRQDPASRSGIKDSTTQSILALLYSRLPIPPSETRI